jgi:hypothetical protein
MMLRLPTNITLNGGDRIIVWNKTTAIAGAFRSELQPNPSYTTDHRDVYHYRVFENGFEHPKCLFRKN